MRLQFVPGREPPALLDLPWDEPLDAWRDERLVRMAHGLSRHVVRFVREGDRVYACKELPDLDAVHEYRMLRMLAEHRQPAVEAVGVVTSRPTGLDAVLLTRYLDYSLPFHYLFGTEGGAALGERLTDAAVVLLVRLHLDGFFWGDCSLSNLLFRRDAGALMAYLVDAETAEHHDRLDDGLRQADVERARENVVGGLLDLQAAGRLAGDVDVVAFADGLEARYTELWDELTGTSEVGIGDRHLVEQRLRRLNDLGFDVGELVVEHDLEAGGDRLRVTPTLVEEGHHTRELRHLTGLDVQENQARRLLNDITGYGAHLARTEGAVPPRAVVAARWLDEVYEPVVASVPPERWGSREAPELFHELLEHRYYLAEAAHRDVTNDEALASYLDSVLVERPPERLLLDQADD
ncbi:MAG TPA: DUF4032 domain-containing protein [Acidimicrobiales bacterium]|nr:DUF4032 domain-containing protein [Acidimicrobiales bacterium]